MIAVAMKQPLFNIDEREAKMLAIGVIDVGKQYSVEINPKLLAWMNLLGAGVAVYGPKAFIMMAMRSSPPKSPPPPRSSGTPPTQPQSPPPASSNAGGEGTLSQFTPPELQVTGPIRLA